MPDATPSSSEQTGSPATAPNRRGPPPPTKQEISNTQRVLLSFWAVVIFLGLPIWWKTTTVYRASLPLDVMKDWSQGNVCQPTFPLRVAVEASHITPQEAQHLIKTTQHALDDLNEFSAHHLRLVVATSLSNETMETEDANVLEDDIALLVRLKSTTSSPTPSFNLHTFSPILDVFYGQNQIPSSSSGVSPLASSIAKELQSIFAEEQATLTHLLSSISWKPTQTSTLSPEMASTMTRRSTRSFKYAPTYHLTFSLFTPNSAPSDWAIESALSHHITPLLRALSPISNFTIDSQLQMYAHFSPTFPDPAYDPESKSYTLNTSDLSGFINAADWPLSPSIGAGPTINFILYVPAPHQTPLLVRENGASSWLIPQWGGIQIFNPPTGSAPSSLSADDLSPVMQTFTNQLLSLLGLPNSPSSLPVRLSTLTRVHAASLIFSASDTLGALARLTKSLPNIPIPNTVAHSVDSTIAHLHAACGHLRQGRFAAALQDARVAEAEVERAFFERSMVGQVYFPDEHKVAVYLPLLGPIAVPLVTNSVREWRRWRLARRG
ncbi:hypothetical protein BT63DRAFT_407161 [Microthyrium microscopicum]|uniref:GPI transamidase component PIG-S n=1 Tax=Microthyrium microscopicum TaxID=703497 RepID=A0A6A6TWB1_9PEZI|nr:hypothetical protein BT63DRAFT_407161 [Microthyrium microscopicum]